MRVLTFEMRKLKLMQKGGRGLLLIDLKPKDTLAGAVDCTRSIRITGMRRGAKPREETLKICSLYKARGLRALKGILRMQHVRKQLLNKEQSSFFQPLGLWMDAQLFQIFLGLNVLGK